MFLALTGIAVLHRLHHRDGAAATAATAALEFFREGDSRRFKNRIDTENELREAAATCHLVLAAIAAQRDEPDQAAVLFAQAEQLRADAGGAEIPHFLRDEVALRP
jgi:hypothetical protein